MRPLRAAMIVVGLLCAATVAHARPFEKLPLTNAAYADLRVLERAGLLDTNSNYKPGTELTRISMASVWTTAFEQLTTPSARANARLPRPDGEIQRLCDSLGRLLEVLAPELSRRGVQVSQSREQLRDVAWWVPNLSALQAATARNTADGPPPRLSGSALGSTSLQTPPLGPASAGLSLRPLAAVEYDRRGPSRLLRGHVLAADLRLRYGDYNVLVEYGRSLVDSRPALVGDDDGGAQLKAHFLTSLRNKVTFDLGYRRYTGRYTGLTELIDAGQSPVQGLHFDVGGQLSRWQLHGGGGFYRPAGLASGFLYQYGTGVSYQPLSSMKLSLGYETSARRSVANLDDAWRDFVNAELDYAIGQRMRCKVDYRFNNLSLGSSTADNSEHHLGVAFVMGF